MEIPCAEYNQVHEENTLHSQKADLGSGQPELLRLWMENDRLRRELGREQEMSIRNLADFDSYRRRVEREQAQAGQASKRELALALINLLDDIEGSLAPLDQEPPAFADTLRAIYQRLTDLLSAQGVSAFESIGQHFDPMRHQAVRVIESQEAESGVILEEVVRGYHWGNELLRPARVSIAQNRRAE
jgi:molecular chaperone GrpE